MRSIKHRYAYGKAANWKVDAEKRVYAGVLKKILSDRGHTTIDKNNKGSFEQKPLASVNDADLIPANGYCIFRTKNNKIVKDFKANDTIMTFRIDENNQEWAIIKEYTSIDSADEDGNPTEIVNDFKTAIDSYNWTKSTNACPKWHHTANE